MAKQDIKPRVRAPKKLKKGDVFEVKTLVTHRMESGQRKDKKTGKTIPRKIIKEFTATYDGNEVMKSVWHPAISANPYLAFYVVAGNSGTMKLVWVDDDGVKYKKEVKINVTG
ncbi:MAG: thiosulfate oxidation carrier complex protein SoxZ [Alphaproteobacteria bacterium]